MSQLEPLSTDALQAVGKLCSEGLSVGPLITGRLVEEVWELRRTERKWNCECCRAAYARGGCPDHGPSLIGGFFD